MKPTTTNNKENIEVMLLVEAPEAIAISARYEAEAISDWFGSAPEAELSVSFGFLVDESAADFRLHKSNKPQ